MEDGTRDDGSRGRPGGPGDGGQGSSRWLVHGERSLYASPWVGLSLLDVEQPGGHRYEHHAVRATAVAAACLVLRDPAPGGSGDEREVLLIWRHRVVTDTWGWEVPAGRVEPGESVELAAAREVEEETGWSVAGVRHLIGFHPIGGVGDQRFEVCLAHAVELVGRPDPVEADRVEWVSLSRARELALAGEVPEGLTLTSLLLLLSGLVD